MSAAEESEDELNRRARAGREVYADGRWGAKGVAGALGDAERVEADLGELLLARRVRDQAVGHAQSGDVLGRQAVGDGVFEDGAAEAVLEGVIFDGQHRVAGLED